ncbi:hypothetical protein TREMEDRAFT_60787 [Tremella mesenterica DSM 1558]|uniref:uncharacterized protein n=1 Tax=Tremella mesenterica (strain ATCC 24925 / CBS 8224 / DSM 1558 / NBRC 9311 / NRRL Y-6157 / RJB 2259-6 / UBC 559-6) TaxID=578456 RepID=UPI0003F48D1A|nr:uncharacterized protein TREMEDRAFT_60787 [Tremella mesenterica DSM 1558]EIW71864.1 hypothetical protein TREMEDRAFT_60787 [Tremella mesenterica DSM 1558]
MLVSSGPDTTPHNGCYPVEGAQDESFYSPYIITGLLSGSRVPIDGFLKSPHRRRLFQRLVLTSLLDFCARNSKRYRARLTATKIPNPSLTYQGASVRQRLFLSGLQHPQGRPSQYGHVPPWRLPQGNRPGGTWDDYGRGASSYDLGDEDENGGEAFADRYFDEEEEEEDNLREETPWSRPYDSSDEMRDEAFGDRYLGGGRQ